MIIICIDVHPVADQIRQRIALLDEVGPRTAACLASVLRNAPEGVIALRGRAVVWLQCQDAELVESIADAGLHAFAFEARASEYVIWYFTNRRPSPDLAQAGAA